MVLLLDRYHRLSSYLDAVSISHSLLISKSSAVNDPDAPNEQDPARAGDSVAGGESPAASQPGSFIVDEMTPDGGRVGGESADQADHPSRLSEAAKAGSEAPKKIKKPEVDVVAKDPDADW